jgi:single-strand DNA-binding protein
MNIITINGNLVHDPQSKTFDNGNEVCRFRLANSRKYTDRNGNEREETLFINIETNFGLAKICRQFLTKGSAVTVCGKLQFKQWESKKDNSTHSEYFIAADEVIFNHLRNESAPRRNDDGNHRRSGNDCPDRTVNNGQHQRYPGGGVSPDYNPVNQQMPPDTGIEDDIPF